MMTKLSLKIFIAVILSALIYCKSRENKKEKILITAPQNYSDRFAVSLGKHHLHSIQLPLITTEVLAESKPMRNLASNLKQYDWVAFSSRKAIEAFFECLEINKIDLKSYNIQFCAIGKDAQLLKKQYNCKVAFTPQEPSPQGIVNELKKVKNIAMQSIAVIAPAVEGFTEPNVVPNFIDSLAKVMQVQRINGYITHINNIDIKKWKSIIEHDVAIIAFTSTGEIEAMIQLFGLQLINKKIIACFGPYTKRNAKKLSVKVDFIADDYSSFDGFATSIEKYCRSKHK